MRPALVCGWLIRPTASSSAMVLRTVALETPSPYFSQSVWLPTGTAVATCSSMIARRIARERASSGPGRRALRRAICCLDLCGCLSDLLALSMVEC